MQTVDEQPETIHLYVVREEEPKPSVFPIVLSALSLVVLFAFCVLVPYQQPVTRAVIRVPAVLLPLRTFTAKVAVIPTGVRTYPATTAHGTLTITNGSVISQTFPAGFKFLTNRGVQVVTDSAVFVPSGNANGYGYTAVKAHALISGISGNLPAYAINTVIGSSVYIRNLRAFYGGHDAYSVKYATVQDKLAALLHARGILVLQINGLHYPCNESYLQKAFVIIMTWRCQMLTYHIAAFYHVTAARLSGNNLIIDVWFIPRPARIWVK
jgi:baseplate J-like protein